MTGRHPTAMIAHETGAGNCKALLCARERPGTMQDAHE